MIRGKNILIYLFLLISVNVLNGQDLKIKNVRFTDLGEKIIIKYDLISDVNRKFRISLSLSDNGGRSFRIHPNSVKGDVGKGIKPGKNKTIEWNLFKDFPDGLIGSNFIFKVEADYRKGKSYLPLYAGGIGAGIMIYVFTREKKKSSIIIQVPSYF